MRDLSFVLLTVGFFGVAAGVVSACERVVGSGPTTDDAHEPEAVEVLQ